VSQHAIKSSHRPENVALLSHILWSVEAPFYVTPFVQTCCICLNLPMYCCLTELIRLEDTRTLKYVSLRTFLSKNRIRVRYLLYAEFNSISVNIDRLTMVDNTSAVGNDSRPWVVPQSKKWLSTITRERRNPLDSESGGIPHLFRTSLSPHIGSAWRARHDNNNNNSPKLIWNVTGLPVYSTMK